MPNLEAGILMWTATSMEQALLVHSLQPAKWLQQWTETDPREKFSSNAVLFELDFPLDATRGGAPGCQLVVLLLMGLAQAI